MAEIKRKDVDSLASKIETFAKTLPEQEQNVLGWILTRAEAATDLTDADLDSVAGGGPLSSQLAHSLGFGATNDNITVSWSKSFKSPSSTPE
jgi:hypothetical protein